MLRALLPALLVAASIAGCASPASLDMLPPSEPAPEPEPAPSPVVAPPPREPSARTPSPLPPTPAPASHSGFVLRAGPTEGGGHAFFDEDGSPAPTLLVPASTTITIDLRRGGEVHGFDLGGKLLAGAGKDDVRLSFTSPESGEIEYGCPVHPHEMRGILRVA